MSKIPFLDPAWLKAGLVDTSGDAGSSGQILSSTGSGVNWINQGDITSGQVDKALSLTLQVKNTESVALTKGQVVCAAPTATPPSGNVIEVKLADNDGTDSMPAIGILNEGLDAAGGENDEGEAIMFGRISGIDTSAFSVGDEVFVSDTAGALIATKPTGVKYIQKVGVVMRDDASNGTIEVFGAGRTNDVPTPLYIDHTNQRLGIGTASPGAKLQVNGGVLLGSAYVQPAGSSWTTSNSQLILGGAHNTEFNDDNPGVKLLISGYNNDGTTLYPIYVEDENGLPDFWLKNRPSGTGLPTAYFAGNVGIGTTSPFTKLHVSGTGLQDMQAWFGNGFINNASYHYSFAKVGFSVEDSDGADTGAGFQFNTRNSGDTNWVHGYIYQPQDGGIAFGTGGAGTVQATEKMRIDSNGDIQFNSYGSGSNTGTVAYNLAVDSSGNIIENSANTRSVFVATSTASGYNINTTTTISWNSEDIKDSGYTHSNSTNNDSITITQAGTYKIYAAITYTTAVERANVALQILVNGTATGTRGAGGYVRSESGHSDGTTIVEDYVTLSANDVIKIQTSQEAAAGTVNLISGESKIIIEKLTGLTLSTTNANTLGGLGATDFVQVSGDTMTGALTINEGGATIKNTGASQSTVLTIEQLADVGSSQDLVIKTAFDRDVGIKFETGGGTNYIWQDSNGDDALIFSTGGSSRTDDAALILQQDQDVIIPNGRLGINELTPNCNLDVKGTVNTTIIAASTLGDAGGTENRGLALKAVTSGGELKTVGGSTNMYLNTANNLYLQNADSTKVTMLANGNVGIGATNPENILHLKSPNPYLILEDTSNANKNRIANVDGNMHYHADYNNQMGNSRHIFYIDNSEKLRINTNGNVGIGTSSPGQKLDVSGNIKMTETAAASDTDKFVVSDSGVLKYRTGAQVLSDIGAAASSHNHDDRYYTETESDDRFLRQDGSGKEFVFEVNDEGNLSGNKWYKIASVNQGNGGLHIRGFIANHVESFTSQKINLAINGRESNDGSNIEVIGTVDVLHNNETGTDKAGIRIIKATDSTYDRYDVYVRTSRYNMLRLHLTKSGNTSFYTSPTPATTEPQPVSGGNVEIDTSSFLPGIHTVTDSVVRQVIKEDGNVGIGTTSPDATLKVQGPSDTATISTSSTPAARINNGGAISLWIGSNFYNYGYVQSIQDDGSNNLKPLSLQPLGGNVGIGTTSPTHLLTLETASSPGLKIKDTTQGATLLAFSQDSNSHIGTYSSHPLVLDTNSSERMRITSAGNVGIGTTSPSQKLHVAGNARVTGAYYDSNNSPGTSNQILSSTVSGTDWVDIGNFGTFLDIIDVSEPGNTTTEWSLIKTLPVSNGSQRDTLFIKIVGGGWNDNLRYEAEITLSNRDGFNYFWDVKGGSEYNTGGYGSNRLRVVAYSQTDGTVDVYLYKTSYMTGWIYATFQNTGAPEIITSLDSPTTTQPSGTEVFTTYGNTYPANIAAVNNHVGIGTNSPAHKLHVVGSALIEGSSTELKVKGSGGYDTANIVMGNAAKSDIFSIDTRNDPGGNYTTLSFDSYQTTGTSTITLGDNYVNLGTAGSSRVTINSTGNVGIGTTSPSQKLHVSGNARVTGAYYDTNNSPGTSGQVLSSTATGTDWVSLSEISGVDGTGTANTVAMWSDSDTITDAPITVSGNNSTFAGDVLVEDNLYLTDAGTVRGKIQLNASDRDDLDIKAVSLGSNMKFFTVDTERMRIDSSGKVGIGTTAPVDILHVDGARSNFNGIKIGENSTNIQFIDDGKLAVGNNDWLIFTEGGQEFMRAGGQGNVGIGTTSPSNKLDVNGNIEASRIILPTTGTAGGGTVTTPAGKLDIRSDSTWSNSAIIARTTTNQNPVLAFYRPSGGSATSYPWWLEANGSTFQIKTGSAANIGSETVSTKVTINSSGNVGIGTTNPTSKLTVVDDILLSGSSPSLTLTDATSSFVIKTNTSGEGILQTSGTSKPIRFFRNNGSNESMRINGDGNVGIGTTSPGKKLHISSTDQSTARIRLSNTNTGSGGDNIDLVAGVHNVTQDGFSVYNATSNQTQLVIQGGGNVGIGTSTPSYKLDVAGTIRATGDVIAYSDVRVKENIKTIDNSLEKVNQLRGVEFNKIGEDKKSIGVIAQEIEKILPEVVRQDDKGMKSVAYGNITAVLIEAIKEQQKQIDELKNKLNAFTK